MHASRRLSLILLLVCALLPGCTWQDKVLQQRFVDDAMSVNGALSEAQWRPATEADIRGSFEMTAVDGEAARTVLRISYYFEDSGRFTGAALIVQSGGPEYQTIAGAWRLKDGRLDLGHGCEAAEASVAGDRLRLRTRLGTAILVRSE